jgi:hypothetical protein
VTHTPARQAGKAKSPLLGGLVRFALGLSRWLSLGLGRGCRVQELARNVVHGERRGRVLGGLLGGWHAGSLGHA